MYTSLCVCIHACLLFSLKILNPVANVIHSCHRRAKDVIIPAGFVTVGNQGEVRHYKCPFFPILFSITLCIYNLFQIVFQVFSIAKTDR